MSLSLLSCQSKLTKMLLQCSNVLVKHSKYAIPITIELFLSATENPDMVEIKALSPHMKKISHFWMKYNHTYQNSNIIFIGKKHRHTMDLEPMTTSCAYRGRSHLSKIHWYTNHVSRIMTSTKSMAQASWDKFHSIEYRITLDPSPPPTTAMNWSQATIGANW